MRVRQRILATHFGVPPIRRRPRRFWGRAGVPAGSPEMMSAPVRNTNRRGRRPYPRIGGTPKTRTGGDTGPTQESAGRRKHEPAGTPALPKNRRDAENTNRRGRRPYPRIGGDAENTNPRGTRPYPRNRGDAENTNRRGRRPYPRIDGLPTAQVGPRLAVTGTTSVRVCRADAPSRRRWRRAGRRGRRRGSWSFRRTALVGPR